ncbi:unnamed protein product [Prunus armeniaca]
MGKESSIPISWGMTWEMISPQIHSMNQTRPYKTGKLVSLWGKDDEEENNRQENLVCQDFESIVSLDTITIHTTQLLADYLIEPEDLTMSSRKDLMEQDLSTIGHVAHGKSTIVKAISGVQTVRFKNELERNITMKLGFANAKIYKCEEDRCPRPMSYKAYGSGMEDNPFCDVPGFENCKMKLLRHGDDILMATMLNGAAIMDGALLLIAANESCPQPQTAEHLAALEIT